MITIYDPAEAMPLFYTTRREWGPNHFETRQTQLGGQPATELIYRRGDDAKPRTQSCLWLPWRPLTQVGSLSVDIFCNSSGAKFYLDCLDGDGWGLRFFLGTDQYDGWHTFRFDPFEITATWGACSGKRTITDPLQPAALIIEDHEDRGTLQLGLGRIAATAQSGDEYAPDGEAACLLNRSTLDCDLTLGGRRLLRDFGLWGLLPGAAPEDFRRLIVRNVTAVAHGQYRAELAAGDIRIPVEIELQQISSQVWVLRYLLRFRAALEVEQLDLRGLIAYGDVAGLEYAAGEDDPQLFDPSPRAEGLLAEPPIWESLTIGRPSGRGLRIKADGPVLKSLRLLDLRVEEDNPCYAVDVTIARDETFAAGAELKFNMLFDGKL